MVELPRPDEARERGRTAAAHFQEQWLEGHDLGEAPLFTLLIDHSGSMRGASAQAACIAAQLLGDAFDSMGVRYEVLGFTTSAWKGGKSRSDWQRAGSPRFPGRLNDLLHIVYRDADGISSDWRRDLDAMLNGPLLKENIDGEALEWAEMRARRNRFSTWVCLCLTDGAPIDDATNFYNGAGTLGWYLGNHLRTVVARLESASDARLGALGLNASRWTSKYYSITLEADDLHDAPEFAFRLLREVVWRVRRAETSWQ